MRLFTLLLFVALAGCQLDAPAEGSDEPVAEAAVEAPAPAPQPPPAPQGEPLGPDGRPEVVLFVTEWCPYCQQAREFMTAEGVPHRVVDIEKDGAGAQEYAARGGTGGIPLVAVGVETIEGWSETEARRMLSSAGYEPVAR